MDVVLDLIELLRPWQAAVLAFVVAGTTAVAAGRLRWPLLAAAAGGLGVLAGWWFAFGLLTASPRQLPERLPLLVLVLVAAAALAGRVVRRWPPAAWPCALLGAAWVGWWIAGAPRVPADLGRAVPVLAGVALATLLIALRAAPAWAAPVAAAVLLAGLFAAAPPGPFVLLGAALLAAALGNAVVSWTKAPRADPLVAALPLAGAIAALAALPVIARGAPADWLVAAAPLAAVWTGGLVGTRLSRRIGPPLGAILAGGGCVLLAVLLR